MQLRRIQLEETMSRMLIAEQYDDLIRLCTKAMVGEHWDRKDVILTFNEIITDIDKSDFQAIERIIEFFNRYKAHLAEQNDPELTKKSRMLLRKADRVMDIVICNLGDIFQQNIDFALAQFDKKNICDRWVEMDLAKTHGEFMHGTGIDRQELFDALQTLNDQAQKDLLINQLIASCVELQNIDMLQWLNEKIPDKVKAYRDECEREPFIMEVMDAINATSDVEHQALIKYTMSQFMAGFGYLDAIGVQVALAAKDASGSRERKTTQIHQSQVDDFLDALQLREKPCRERCVVDGDGHWVSFEASIDENNQLTIFVIDSLGTHHSADGTHVNDIIRDIIECPAVKYHDGDIHIFQALEKRQHAGAGCSVFALDDASHLYSVDDYLDKTKYPNGLADYLQNNIVETIEHKGVDINIVNLPLHLIRTMQSRDLLSVLESEREGEDTLNKKGVTPKMHASQKIGFFASDNPGQGEQNKRLDQKLDKMMRRTFEYLKSKDYPTIQAAMKEHTLEGFQVRCMAGQSLKPAGKS